MNVFSKMIGTLLSDGAICVLRNGEWVRVFFRDRASKVRHQVHTLPDDIISAVKGWVGDDWRITERFNRAERMRQFFNTCSPQFILTHLTKLQNKYNRTMTSINRENGQTFTSQFSFTETPKLIKIQSIITRNHFKKEKGIEEVRNMMTRCYATIKEREWSLWDKLLPMSTREYPTYYVSGEPILSSQTKKHCYSATLSECYDYVLRTRHHWIDGKEVYGPPSWEIMLESMRSANYSKGEQTGIVWR